MKIEDLIGKEVSYMGEETDKITHINEEGQVCTREEDGEEAVLFDPLEVEEVVSGEHEEWELKGTLSEPEVESIVSDLEHRDFV